MTNFNLTLHMTAQSYCHNLNLITTTNLLFKCEKKINGPHHWIELQRGCDRDSTGMSSYLYWNSYNKDNMASQPSYLYNGNLMTGKKSLYISWNVELWEYVSIKLTITLLLLWCTFCPQCFIFTASTSIEHGPLLCFSSNFRKNEARNTGNPFSVE